jgi:hypothetical protein
MEGVFRCSQEGENNDASGEKRRDYNTYQYEQDGTEHNPLVSPDG